MSQRILVYGATGYTGKLVAAEAARRDLDVVLAGRDPEKLKAVASPLGLESRAFALEDAARLRASLEDVAAVLHIAGPFSTTAHPMVEGCIATRTHYLDVTGEIDVFQAIAQRDERARALGIVLLPGVGFDVVPSDCLAAHVAARVESAQTVRIAIAGVSGGVSRGTAKTSVEALADGLRLRRDGVIVRQPPGSLERHFDLGAGPLRAVGVPLGDVATVFYSTGAPNVETYFVASGAVPRMLRASRFLLPLLRTKAVQRFLKRRVDAMPEGPDDATRESTRAMIYAEATGTDGETARAMLETPSGYQLTLHAAVESARRVAAGEAPAGYQTPATAFGADFVLELPDCQRTDLD